MSRGEFCIKCRGLPWSCTDDDIREFFGSAARSIVAIKLTKDRNGRASGEGYVVFSDRDDFEHGLTKHKSYIGKRYIELNSVPLSEAQMGNSREDGRDGGRMDGRMDGRVDRRVENRMDRRMEGLMDRPRIPDMDRPIIDRELFYIRCGGLPYGCTKEDLVRFFSPFEIARNGILFIHDRRSGKFSGEAFVGFIDSEIAKRALEKDKQYIQHRYIDVQPAAFADVMRSVNGDRRDDDIPPWERDARGPRGLPYERPPMDPRDRYYRPEEIRPRRNEMWVDRFDEIGGFGEGYGGRSAGGPMRRGWRDEPPIGRRGFSPRRRYSPQLPPMEFCIRMRGLPYHASERDIIEFFNPLRPASIDMLYEVGTDRPSGEAVVEFRNRGDFHAAMQKHRMYMGNRYVELIPEA